MKLNNRVKIHVDLPRAQPSKWYVVQVRFKQFIFKNKSSYPYITSDAFRELSDIEYPYHSHELTKSFEEKLFNSEIIFCPSHLLDKMLENYSGKINAKVIICSHSDHEFHDKINNLPSSVRLVLLTNSFISDNKVIFTLPMGIENLKIGMNGMKSFFRFSGVTTRLNSVLFGPFSPTHPVRSKIVNQFLVSDGPWKIIMTRLHPKKYSKLASKYQFIACIRGNSVESHRLWESLYRGSTPLLLKDKWSKSLLYLNLPILYVNSWSPEAIKEIVNSSQCKTIDPKTLETLWMPYWENFINGFVTAKS